MMSNQKTEIVMRYLYFTLLLLGAGLFSSCIDSDDDLFGEKLEVTVGNIEKNIRVNIGDVLQLNPTISPDDREYDCFWGVANRNNTYSVIDTISFERNLNYTVTLNTGNYTLRFCAKDKETGVFSYTEYNLSVETDMSTGWWVLKQGVNGTDVDLFTPEKAIRDVVYSRNGVALQGKPVDLAYTPNYFVFDPKTDTDVNHNIVVLTSESDIMFVDYFTGKVLKTYDELFMEAPANRSVQGVFKGASDVHLIADGKLYTMPISRYTPHYRQFIIQHTGDYKLSKYRVASGWSNPMLFDEASSSFCIADRGASDLIYGLETASPAHRNLNMDLLYMGGRTTSSSGGENGYALLKEKGADVYHLAYIDATRSSYDLTSSSPDYHCVVLESKTLPNSLGLLSADVRALSQDNNIMYFAKDNKVYLCNLETLEEREQSVGYGAGETVTYMEYAKFMQPYNDQSKWFGYLMIGTVSGDSYKLYMHPVQGGNIQPAVQVLEGKGEVKRAIYIANLSGTIYPSVYL